MRAAGRRPARCARPSPAGPLPVPPPGALRAPRPPGSRSARPHSAPRPARPPRSKPRAAHAAFQLSSGTPLTAAPPIRAPARGRGRSLGARLAEPNPLGNARGGAAGVAAAGGRRARCGPGLGRAPRRRRLGWSSSLKPPAARRTPHAGCPLPAADATSNRGRARAAGPGKGQGGGGTRCLAAWAGVLLPAAAVSSSRQRELHRV